MNKHLQAQVLETVYRDYVRSCNATMPNEFINFLLLFGGKKKRLERAFSEIGDLQSLSPECGTAFKLWLLHWIGCGADKNTADPAISFAALLSHINAMEDAELVDALPWLPAFCHRDIDDDECPSATTAKGSAHLMQIYFDRCARLEPALAVTIHLASIETVALTYGMWSADWREPKEMTRVAEGMMQSMLQLKGQALVVAVQELLYRCPYVIDKPGADPVALCRHIQQSVSAGKAVLMIELLKVMAFNETSNEVDGPYFNFAEGDGAGAVALREIFAMFLALPSQEISADALAMFSCVIAYMPSSELQSRAVDRIIALMGAKEPSEHLLLLVLLAHLSTLLDGANRQCLRDMLRQAAGGLPQEQSSTLIAAMRDADAIESICAGKGLFMEGTYPGLYCVDTIKRQARTVLEDTLNVIQSSAQREQFIASFFVQLNALGGWPKFGPRTDAMRRRNGAVESRAGLPSDAEPQSEASKLARMASPAVHIAHLSTRLDTKGIPCGVCYVMEMVLRKPLSIMRSKETEELPPHVKFLHELSIRLGNNADSVLKECIDAGMVANNTQGLALLKHWKPVLPKLTREERHRILTYLASTCFRTEAPPSATDLVFIHTMIDMASLLRDGDKPHYLRTLLEQVAMPPCEERDKVFSQIREIDAKLPKQFDGQINLKGIVLMTDSQRFFSLMRQQQKRNTPLTRTQAQELIATAALDMFLDQEQVEMLLLVMSNSWHAGQAAKLDPEHWTALLLAFEQKYGKATQTAGNPTPLPVVTEHAVDHPVAFGHAQPIPRLDDEEIDIDGFGSVDFYEEWDATGMQ